MRKNTCILIMNWRKLPQNTNRRICSSRQDLQTQEMNIKVTNIISDIPSCCISLGMCVGPHSLRNMGSHSPKRYVFRPQAGIAWKLAPVPLKPVGLQVLVPQQGAISPAESSCTQHWSSPVPTDGRHKAAALGTTERQQHQVPLLKNN